MAPKIPKFNNAAQTLFLAAKRNNKKLILQSLQAGASIDMCDPQTGLTVLHHAILDGRTDACRMLLELGADPSMLSRTDQAPLHYAARRGQLNACKFLLSFGAEVNQTDADGWTALHRAIAGGHIEIAESLLDAGAALEIQEKQQGRTPLHLAVAMGYGNACKLLLNRGADISAKNALDFNSPLHFLGNHFNYPFAGERDAPQVIGEILLAAGADLEALNRQGTPPIVIALKNGWEPVGCWLIDAGASLGFQNILGQGLLHIAAQHGCLTVCQKLLQAGLDVWAQDNHQRKPLDLVHIDHPDLKAFLEQHMLEIGVQNVESEKSVGFTL